MIYILTRKKAIYWCLSRLIIWAKNEEEAREAARKADEKSARPSWYKPQGLDPKDWLDKEKSTCEVINVGTDPLVISTEEGPSY